MSEKLIIGKPQYECPICATEWYEFDLYHLEMLGCPGCSKKIDLSQYLHEGEPFWHDWREKCYDRMKQEHDRNSEGEKLVQEYEAMFAEIQESERALFNQILNDERDDQNNL